MSKVYITSMLFVALFTYLAIPDAHAISASQIKRHIEQNNRQSVSAYNKERKNSYESQQRKLDAYQSQTSSGSATQKRYEPSANLDQNAQPQPSSDSYQQPAFTTNRGSGYGGSAGSTSGSGASQKSGGNMWGF